MVWVAIGVVLLVPVGIVFLGWCAWVAQDPFDPDD